MGTKTRSAYCLSGWCSVSTLQISHGVEATERCNYLASVLVPQLVAARRSCNQQSGRNIHRDSRANSKLRATADVPTAAPPRFPPLDGRLDVVPPQQLQHRTPPHFLVRAPSSLVPPLGASQWWRALRWMNVRPIRTPESPEAETETGRLCMSESARGGASILWIGTGTSVERPGMHASYWFRIRRGR